MAKSKANSWMANEIFKKLTGLGHRVYMYDSSGKRVFDPSDATRIFSNNIKMMVTLGYTQGSSPKPLVTFHTSDVTPPEALADVKQSLKSHNVFDHSFDTLPFGKTLEPRHFAHAHRGHDDVKESTTLTRKSTLCIGDTQIISEHALPSEKITKIIVIGPNREEYRMPVKSMVGAKALAYHVNNGGDLRDETTENIKNLLKNISQLNRLERWMKQEHPDFPALRHIKNSRIYLTKVLRGLSDQNTHRDASRSLEKLVSTWNTNQLYQEPQISSSQDTYEPVSIENIPEWKGLMEYFSKRDMNRIYDNDQDQQIRDASKQANSQDPRTVLHTLIDTGVEGWKARFQENPREIMDQIADVLKDQ